MSLPPVTLGDLNLNAGSPYFVDGEVNPADWFASEGQLILPVMVNGSSAANAASLRRAIQGEINRAETLWRRGREKDLVTLSFDLQTGTTISFSVRGGRVRTRRRFIGGAAELVDVVLDCESERGVPVAYLAADARSTSATLTNGSAKVLLDGVGGDRPGRARIEIQDVSTDGVINRIRMSLVSGEELALSDWSPWVDIANAGSSNQSESAAFGDSFEQISLDSVTDWTYLGRAVMPSGALQRGWRHLYLRMRDHAVTAAAPTGLTSTVEAPDVPGTISARQSKAGNNGGGGASVSVTPTVQTQAGSTLGIVAKAKHPPVPLPERRAASSGVASGTGTSPSRNWSTSTIAGSLLVMRLRFEGAFGDWTPPPNWTIANSASTEALDAHVVELYREGAPSSSGAQSGGSFANSVAWAMVTEEWTGVATSGALVGVGSSKADAAGSAALSLTLPNDVPVAAILAASALDGSGSFATWGNQFTERVDAGGLGTADRVVTAGGAVSTTAVIRQSPDDHASIITAYRAAQFTPDPIALTPPNGYALGGIASNLDNPQKPVTTALFYRQNAPATSAAQIVTFNTPLEAVAAFVELPKVAASGALVASATSTDDGLVAQLGPTGIVEHEGAIALAAFGAWAESTSWSGWSGGFANQSTSGGLSVALLSSAEIQAWATAALKSGVDASAHVLAVFRQEPVEEGDAPGGLEPGVYGFRARAVTRSSVGAASSTRNQSVTVAGSAVTLGWNAPSATSISHYEIEVSFAGTTYLIVTEDSATSYRLETLDGLPELAFGSSSAAPARIQVQIGTDAMTASTAALRNENYEVIHTGRTDSARLGDWHLVGAGYAHLPPQQQLADGDEPGWAVEVFGKSGGGPAANLDIDALVLFSDESGMALEYLPLDLAVKRKWVAEIRRDGSVVAWLEDGAGNVVGQIKPHGALHIPTSDSILSLVFEHAGGVLNVDGAQATVQVTIYPTVDWLV